MAVTVALAIGGCHRRASTASRVPPPPVYAAGTMVAGVPVAGSTQDQATPIVRKALERLTSSRVILYYGAHSYARRWSDLGIAPDIDAMLAKAWKTPVVPLTASVALGKAKDSIRHAAAALVIAPVPPHFVGSPAKGLIKPGRGGRRVDVYASAMALQSAIAKDAGTQRSPLMVFADNPSFSMADLSGIRVRLVAYTTRFNPGEANRTHNLQLVSRRLNGAFVKPGEVFSFNEWVGERRPSEGFRQAIVYKFGKMEEDTGGGLCQVSSTLYNVALLTGLPIRQRTHHSLTVHYVPLGRDATVYWGTHDLRFENDMPTAIYIHTVVRRASLTIEAWGSAPLDRRVQITSTPSWKDGKATARVYRTIAENGKHRREMISEDEYDTHHVMSSTPDRSHHT
jgi:vancomycin resistance protein YoaR